MPELLLDERLKVGFVVDKPEFVLSCGAFNSHTFYFTAQRPEVERLDQQRLGAFFSNALRLVSASP